MFYNKIFLNKILFNSHNSLNNLYLLINLLLITKYNKHKIELKIKQYNNQIFKNRMLNKILKKYRKKNWKRKLKKYENWKLKILLKLKKIK